MKMMMKRLPLLSLREIRVRLKEVTKVEKDESRQF
jgi:hypothetical protein